MELKAINIKQKEFKDEEDFFLSCEAFIGPENKAYVYEVYDFNIISVKRLYKDLQDAGIMLNKGWMITKYYDEGEVRAKIGSIIKECTSNNDDETYLKISSYLRMQQS